MIGFVVKQVLFFYITDMSKRFFYFFISVVAIGILLVLNLLIGAVHIPWQDVVAVLLGNDKDMVGESVRYIVLESRLPQAITALLAGMALSVSGLLLQTTFRNPLAGPDVFGISSGASLAVALVMLGMGGSFSVGEYAFGGFLAVSLAAFLGAMVVIAIISLFSAWVRNHVVLLIIGIMVGYLAGSAISLLNFFATAEGVKSYTVWGMGSFGNVTMAETAWLGLVVFLGLFLSLLMVKPLNALLLGEQYAQSLGVAVRKTRFYLLVLTGLLTAVVTAFCGPIAFVGLVTPHLARMILVTDNHRLLLPFTMLLGAVICLLCNLVCNFPSENGILPLNAITPFFGAPVIIYILTKRK